MKIKVWEFCCDSPDISNFFLKHFSFQTFELKLILTNKKHEMEKYQYEAA